MATPRARAVPASICTECTPRIASVPARLVNDGGVRPSRDQQHAVDRDVDAI